MERNLFVASEPTGARVWVNGVDRGTTPVRVPYVHPGTFTVRLEKEGFESVSAEVTTPTTRDAVPGPDFFYENGPWCRRSDWCSFYRLPPLRRERLSPAEQQEALRRAEAFRERTRAAASEPETPSPTRPAQDAGGASRSPGR
jgi:hypothetical protein